ncbi:MAG: DUF2007 domain-containing protein [Bacillota bacterium]
MSDFKLQHLITTGAREAEMIEALLNDNNIEVIVRHDEFGGYSMIYMGYSAYNIELYVAENNYKQAKELLKDLNIESQNQDDNNILVSDDISNDEKDKSISFYLAQIAKIIIILYLLLNLIALIF